MLLCDTVHSYLCIARKSEFIFVPTYTVLFHFNNHNSLYLLTAVYKFDNFDSLASADVVFCFYLPDDFTVISKAACDKTERYISYTPFIFVPFKRRHEGHIWTVALPEVSVIP